MKVNVRQTSKDICNLFEDLLSKHDIKIPDEYREGNEEEACIYGETYCELEDRVTKILANILDETKRNDLELETDTYNFTKCIAGVYYLDEGPKKLDKYAIEVQETSTRIVIVDAVNYQDAELQVMKAYKNDTLRSDTDTSVVDVEYSDFTDKLKETVGTAEFTLLPETDEIMISRFKPIEFKKEEESCQEE